MSDGVYAEMIEIPVSTCEMVILPKKRKRTTAKKKVVDNVKKNLVSESRVEGGMEFASRESAAAEKEQKKTKPKKKFTFDVISAEVIAIFVLIVGILVTNIFWEDSGINNALRNVFGTQTKEETDTRNYSDFTVYSPSHTGTVSLNGGVMTIDGEGAIYSPCLGVISDITENSGKYTITIRHSDLFKTIIKNVDYAYFDIGETVYQAVPVCYSYEGGTQVLMYNDNALLTNYTIDGGTIIWES